MVNTELGLFHKFEVKRTDGRQNREGARFFVLNYAHDLYARDALQAYADACRTTHPKLATDLDHELFEVRDIEASHG